MVANEFYDYPPIMRSRGDIQAITITAKRYMINFKTALVSTFFKRQRAYIQTWLDVNHLTQQDQQKGLAYEIQCLINGWKKRPRRPPKKRQKCQRTEIQEPDPMPPQVIDFIEQERQLLGQPADLSDKQLKHDLWRTIRYLHHTLKFYEEYGVGKGFSLAPVARVKSHFMTIDTVVLFELLKNVASALDDNCPLWLLPVLRLSIKDVRKGDPKHPFKDIMWRKTFNLDGLRRRMRFNYQIDTDGISMSSHFVATKKSGVKKLKRRRYRARRRMSSEERVIAIDPGRTNLITAYDTYTGSYKTLSRGGYRQAIGFAVRQKNAVLREAPLHGINQSLSRTSMRTSNRLKMYSYRQVLIRNYEKL